MAAVGVAKPDRQLVVDEPAAAIGENGWPIGQVRPVLLADEGRESSDPAAVREHGTKDRRPAGINRTGRGRVTNQAEVGGAG